MNKKIVIRVIDILGILSASIIVDHVVISTAIRVAHTVLKQRN